MRILNNNLFNILDVYTGDWVTFLKTTVGYDGTTITSLNESTYIDGIIYVKLTSAVGGGYAKRILLDGTINVKAFGVIGDGVTDDYLNFQTALKITSTYTIPLIIPSETIINLNSKILSIYDNVNLIFKGGVITNGTIIGNSTEIQAGIFKIFDTSLVLQGTFTLDYICPQHFGARTNGDSETFENDISVEFQACIDSNIYIKFPEGFYYLSNPVYINHSQTIELLGTSEIISGNQDAIPGHSRIYTDQNINLINIQSGGITITGGVLDVIGVTGFTKAVIRFDLNYEIWDGYYNTYIVGDFTQLNITEGLAGYGYHQDMSNLTVSGGCLTHVTFGGYIKSLPTGVYSDPFPDDELFTFINSNNYDIKMHSCKQFYNIQGSGGVSSYKGFLQCADVLTPTEKLAGVYPFELNSAFNELNTFLWDINLRDQDPQISYKLTGYTFIGPFTQFHYNGISNKENVQAERGIDNPVQSTISKDKYGYSGTFVSKLDSDMAAFDKRNVVTMKAYKGAGINFDTNLNPMVIAETTDITITNGTRLFRNIGLAPTILFTNSADLDVDFVEIVLTPSSGTFQWSAIFLYLYQTLNYFKRIQFIDHYTPGVPTEYSLYPTLDTTNPKKQYKWFFNDGKNSDQTIIRLIGNKIANSDIQILDLAGRGTTLTNSPYITTDDDSQIKYGSLTTTNYKLLDLNTAPASAGAAGVKGDIRVTATHIYVCTATNTWVRTALTTW